MTELECLSYGSAQTDEGVCLLVRMGPHRILLDCGLPDVSSLQAGTDELPADLVLCSHAHPDHARGLLSLNQAFPQLPIYASEVTCQLLPLNWPEIAPESRPNFCRALPWRSPVEFQEGLSAQLFPAGHLPGAAAFLLTYTAPQPHSGGKGHSYTLLYTGDFFLSNSRLVEGLPLEELRGLGPDVLIVEGSYGTARHLHRRQQESQLMERISRAIAQQQSVLMPVPPLGPGQEVLMLLRSHHYFTGRDLDIWVDSTIAAGCDAYLKLLSHFPASVQNFAQHQSLFWDERIRPRVRRLSPDRYPLLNQSTCLILADEQANFSQYCQPDAGHCLLLLQQQPRQLGMVTAVSKQEKFAKLHLPLHLNQSADALETLYSAVQAGSLNIETYLLPDHCDGAGTTQLIHNLRPQHVVFVHGSPLYLADLTDLEELQNRYQLHLPGVGKRIELPIGETFLRPAVPDANYEGELTELETVVTINLPSTITTDPRWQNFADTGMVEARWQGEELLLRGVLQQELLNHLTRHIIPIDTQCCGNCQHYHGQRCWNRSSALCGFKVTPDGYCPVYEPIP